jgi:hypothetical protein
VITDNSQLLYDQVCEISKSRQLQPFQAFKIFDKSQLSPDQTCEIKDKSKLKTDLKLESNLIRNLSLPKQPAPIWITDNSNLLSAQTFKVIDNN